VSRHQARQRFGQNFLTDLAVIDQIIHAISPQPGEAVVEIGPGLSALTAPLVQRLGHLTVIEIDRDLAERLRRRYPVERLTVIEGDALDLDWRGLGENLRLVGNLPYNISTPLLFACLGIADQVRDQHFMLQREVVDRMVARAGESDYSRLSVMLQYRYRMEKLFDVSPEAFDPPPKVFSAVVRMTPLGDDRPRARDEVLFATLVQRAFSQRRKMLRGALGEWAKLIDWQAIGVEPTARADAVSVSSFIRMSDSLSDALSDALSDSPTSAPNLPTTPA
jgi:16S rRNA (adenine1518-N6/adenine1519-N6)-dimethyltransferase